MRLPGSWFEVWTGATTSVPVQGVAGRQAFESVNPTSPPDPTLLLHHHHNCCYYPLGGVSLFQPPSQSNYSSLRSLDGLVQSQTRHRRCHCSGTQLSRCVEACRVTRLIYLLLASQKNQSQRGSRCCLYKCHLIIDGMQIIIENRRRFPNLTLSDRLCLQHNSLVHHALSPLEVSPLQKGRTCRMVEKQSKDCRVLKG